MFKRYAELQVLMSDFSWTKNVVQFLVSVYNKQLNFNNSISLKKCVLYTENYGSFYIAFIYIASSENSKTFHFDPVPVQKLKSNLVFTDLT